MCARDVVQKTVARPATLQVHKCRHPLRQNVWGAKTTKNQTTTVQNAAPLPAKVTPRSAPRLSCAGFQQILRALLGMRPIKRSGHSIIPYHHPTNKVLACACFVRSDSPVLSTEDSSTSLARGSQASQVFLEHFLSKSGFTVGISLISREAFRFPHSARPIDLA